VPGKTQCGPPARLATMLFLLGLCLVGTTGCRQSLPFHPPPASPQFLLVVEPADLAPGEAALGTLWTIGGPLPAATLEAFGREQPMFQVGNRLVALVGVPASQDPGKALVTARLEGPGAPGEVTAMVNVRPRQFPVSRIRATPSQTEARSEQKLREDQARVRKAKSNSAPRPLWEGEFIMPVDAPVSTPYGLTRYINDREAGRHSGIDLAAPAGAPVLATNGGQVVFAGRLHAAGLTVIIDHGLFLFSSYSHLSRIGVKVGDRVTKGQVVGWVGNTGFSTGPHLHWSTTVGFTAVDPMSLIGPRPWLQSLSR